MRRRRVASIETRYTKMMGKGSTRAITFSRCVTRTRPSSHCGTFYTRPRAHSAWQRQISQNSAHSALAIADFSRQRLGAFRADRKSRQDLLRRRSFLSTGIVGVDWTARLTVANDLQFRRARSIATISRDKSKIEDWLLTRKHGFGVPLIRISISYVIREEIRIVLRLASVNNLYSDVTRGVKFYAYDKADRHMWCAKYSFINIFSNIKWIM